MAESYGLKCRESDFQLDAEHCFINHGSYGAIPHSVFARRYELQQELELNPDNWFRRNAKQMWLDNIEAGAKFLGADPQNMVLVPNATTAINCIVKSLRFEKGDAILVNTWTYKAVQNVCHSAITRAGGELLFVEVGIPVSSSAQMVQKYKEFLAQHSNVKLVVLDLISSASATVWPLSELVPLCHEAGAMVLVDGAHGPGQMPLQLDQLGERGVDFFTGNFHKWAFCPRGCAALWVHPRHHKVIRPVVTSHYYQYDDWRDDFFTQGTTDNSAYYALTSALDYYQSKGGIESISAHNTALVSKAAASLAKRWGTELFPIPVDMEAPFMRIIRLPDLEKHPVPEECKTVGFSEHLDLIHDLYANYGIAAYVLYIDGGAWVRISAQIYNVDTDYEKLAEAVVDIGNK